MIVAMFYVESALLVLIHLLLSFKFTLERIFKCVKNCFSFGSVNAHRLRSDAKALHKLPVHLGIVVVEDEISFRDIGKIVVWSVISGIPWITIFDKNGVCKKNFARLQEAINAEQRQSYLKSTTCDIKVHNGSCRESSLGQGSASGNVIVVSPADGCDKLAAITADLAHLYDNQRLSLADFNVTKINSIIADYYGFPDPELLMKFGPVDAVLGYLPWHMRLTEIVSWPSHRNMTYATFHQLLVTYSGTQQRCGK